jgi:VP9 protein
MNRLWIYNIQKHMIKTITNAFKYSLSNVTIEQGKIVINWTTNFNLPHKLFSPFFELISMHNHSWEPRCILFNNYCSSMGRGNHLTINLDVINNDITSNTIHRWSCFKFLLKNEQDSSNLYSSSHWQLLKVWNYP